MDGKSVLTCYEILICSRPCFSVSAVSAACMPFPSAKNPSSSWVWTAWTPTSSSRPLERTPQPAPPAQSGRPDAPSHHHAAPKSCSLVDLHNRHRPGRTRHLRLRASRPRHTMQPLSSMAEVHRARAHTCHRALSAPALLRPRAIVSLRAGLFGKSSPTRAFRSRWSACPPTTRPLRKPASRWPAWARPIWKAPSARSPFIPTIPPPSQPTFPGGRIVPVAATTIASSSRIEGPPDTLRRDHAPRALDADRRHRPNRPKPRTSRSATSNSS